VGIRNHHPGHRYTGTTIIVEVELQVFVICARTLRRARHINQVSRRTATTTGDCPEGARKPERSDTGTTGHD